MGAAPQASSTQVVKTQEREKPAGARGTETGDVAVGRHGTGGGALGPRARFWGVKYFSASHKKHISGVFCLFYFVFLVCFGLVFVCLTRTDLEAGPEGMTVEGSRTQVQQPRHERTETRQREKAIQENMEIKLAESLTGRVDPGCEAEEETKRP